MVRFKISNPKYASMVRNHVDSMQFDEEMQNYAQMSQDI